MKLLVPVLLILCLGIGFYLWQRSPESSPSAIILNSTAVSSAPITIGRYYWPGMYWLEIADKKGWFKEAGLNVKLIDTNPDYNKSLADMAAGKIDVNTFNVFDLAAFNSKGADMRMVFYSDYSNGSEAIISTKDIGSVSALKGKKVGVGKGSYTEYILDTALKKYNVNPDEVLKIDILSENADKEFISKKLDAVAVWEPVASSVVEKGGKKIFDTAEIPGAVAFGTVFHQDFTKKRPDDVRKIIQVWRKTSEYMKQNPTDSYGIIAEIYGVDSKEVEEFTKSDKIMTSVENKQAFLKNESPESIYRAIDNVNQFLLDGGLITKKFEREELIDDSFIKEIP